MSYGACRYGRLSFIKTSNASGLLAQRMQMINCETDKGILPVEVEIKIRENVFLRGFHHSVKMQLLLSERNLGITQITSYLTLSLVVNNDLRLTHIY